MKDVLEVVIRNLVEDKQAVSIQETNPDQSILLQVKVAKDDMGRVIGKQGRVAKSIRTLMKALASKNQKKLTIEFIG